MKEELKKDQNLEKERKKKYLEEERIKYRKNNNRKWKIKDKKIETNQHTISN